jgi:parvulin-like peptidyl-prolyl isomerase
MVACVGVAVLCLLVPLNGRAQVSAEIIDGVAALVNEHIITFSDVISYSGAAERSTRAAYGDNPAELRKRLQEVRTDALQTLIERALILDEFKEKGYQLPDYLIESRIREIVTTDYGGNRNNFLRSLRAQGLTLDAFRKRIREQFIVSSMSHREIAGAVVVSPYKMEQHYQANLDKFKVEDQVHLRMILLTKKKLTPEQASTKKLIADEIVMKLGAGSDFASMAKIYSEQPQRETGGDWGWVDRKTLREELRGVAFSLKAGENSPVVETKEGFYILRVDEAKSARVLPLAEVRDQIERVLEQEERARLQKQWVGKLKKKAFIRVYPPFADSAS